MKKTVIRAFVLFFPILRSLKLFFKVFFAGLCFIMTQTSYLVLNTTEEISLIYCIK